MKHIMVMIAAALFCVAVSAQAQTSIKPASIYHRDGTTVVSPNQSGWVLLRTNKSETVFEKRGEGGILNASVKTIRTKTFETDKDRLAGWETLKQEEFSKLKQDHIHFNYIRFKGLSCLLYDGIFPFEKTSSNRFAHFNVKGYLCPRANAEDSAVQIEFSNYSNTRGLTEDLSSLSEEFFEKLTFPKPLQARQVAANEGRPVPIAQLGQERSGPRTSFASISGLWDSLRVVIRDQDAWRDMWKRIHSPDPKRGPYPELPPLPEIDFSRAMIIVVAMGRRPSSAYAIIIDGAYERDDRLEISVRSVSGNNCFAYAVMTAPVDIVRLPRTERSVTFLETDVSPDCK